MTSSLSVVLVTYILSQVITCQGHVGLYYPPARTYALDFLDSARTVPPCGMAAGQGPVTDLLAGSSINVSWYLGYAHSGGFRIELLRYDTSGATYATTYLTKASPPDAYISMNVTTTSYPVTLPNNTCNNCTIRLVRQALNWGPSYIFWSCADVNIVSATTYTPSCGGRGSYNSASSSCQCSGLYSGSSCEFTDECSTDADCGANGQCKQITEFSYPQRQCFCLPGWFGTKCEKVSTLTSVQFDQSLYNDVILSSTSGVQMYYRILQDSGELEVVLKGQTKSYLGLGWKSINKVCVPFSLRYTATGNSSAQPLPEGSGPTPHSPVAEGTPNPEPKVEPLPEQPAAEPKVEPSPEKPSAEPGAAEPEVSGSGDVNGMDCTDIVIGAAIGNLSRVGDYYTGDRSTPRHDEFYGGTQTSLTAAVGSESSDGVTTIMFRKKLIANELTDNSVTNDVMTVIWAHGQAPGDSPAAGDFYRQDEIKYHSTHRGVTKLNFYGPPPPQNAVGNSDSGSGSWSYPTGCPGSGACQYQATWSLDAASDVISFNIVANQSQSYWTAIGFAQEQKMENMDVYMAYVDTSNRESAVDGWTGATYTAPKPDPIQNIQSPSVSYESGLLTFSFKRPRQTNDKNDWSFTNNNCYYFFFPVGGGPIVNNSTVGIHSKVPMVSPNKICIAPPTATAGATAEYHSLASSHHVITFVTQQIAVLVVVFSIRWVAY